MTPRLVSWCPHGAFSSSNCVTAPSYAEEQHNCRRSGSEDGVLGEETNTSLSRRTTGLKKSEGRESEQYAYKLQIFKFVQSHAGVALRTGPRNLSIQHYTEKSICGEFHHK